ncbi:hypothetical protein QQP08_016779 [Theobroma cacao]|nr:hypothetical protein QQP08_016779 [Theobroma cacao]
MSEIHILAKLIIYDYSVTHKNRGAPVGNNSELFPSDAGSMVEAIEAVSGPLKYAMLAKGAKTRPPPSSTINGPVHQYPMPPPPAPPST